MKSNDNIPAEEMVLAIALREVAARKLKSSRDVMFRDRRGRPIWLKDLAATDYAEVGATCIMGAMRMANVTFANDKVNHYIIEGNDCRANGRDAHRVDHSSNSALAGRAFSLGVTFEIAARGGL